MEIEVKIRLQQAAYQSLYTLLNTKYTPIAVKLQTNCFFDNPNHQLASTKSVFRIRKSESGDKTVYTATLKANSIIKNGIQTSEENEQVLPNQIALDIISQLSLPLDSREYPILQIIYEKLGGNKLLPTGSFHNKRCVFDYEGLTLELDETTYDFGTAYELEVESNTADQARDKIVALLNDAQIPFTFSKSSKFKNLINGRID